MLLDIINKCISDAQSKRASLNKTPGIFLGNKLIYDRGVYLTNYANCAKNRCIDIFDDAIFLLENNRISSACIVSRGMIETYALLRHLASKIRNTLSSKSGPESAEAALEIVVRFTNSSRLKVSEQKKVEKGIFKIEDYQFTEQARGRMLNSLAGSEHVVNALRDMYAEEMEHAKSPESQVEILYDGLSEWVHPSQTSIFHHYTEETHLIETSQGRLHLHNMAKLQCAKALHLITDVPNVCNYLEGLAKIISERDKLEPK